MLGSDEGIKLVSTDGKVTVTILGNVYGITLGIDVGTELGSLDGFLDGSMVASLRGVPVASRAGYHVVGACVICRFSLTAVTASALSVLICSGVLIVVVVWIFGGVGCLATSKGAGL